MDVRDYIADISDKSVAKPFFNKDEQCFTANITHDCTLESPPAQHIVGSNKYVLFKKTTEITYQELQTNIHDYAPQYARYCKFQQNLHYHYHCRPKETPRVTL